MLCLKKKLRKLLEELLDQKLLERLGGESKNEKLYITGNLFAEGCTFSGPVNFGGGAAQAQPVSYSDEQVAQALANIVGRGKAIDAKKKWAGAIWLLQWVCSYPSNTKQACERIRSLPLPADLEYECDYRNVRELTTLSFFREDARRLDTVKYSKNDEEAFKDMTKVVVALDAELKKTSTASLAH